MDLLIHDLAAACERDAASAYAMPGARASYLATANVDDPHEPELGAPGVGAVRLGAVAAIRDAGPDRSPARRARGR